ncbi:hypothetical protein QCE73_37355 [Caballeronia sp. LZ029]|uniref:hypothetical protein n=1 Tax=Caballeronia sp. LZ029 TaxID=3038564 RepID=UPI002861AFC4|nr:hypothetical protein [Caballeronia sp. LZ029]MDR5748850.1 hypothetical protein [Caballeronia sp. LZ029]
MANFAASPSGLKAMRGTSSSFYQVSQYELFSILGVADTPVAAGKVAHVDVAIDGLPPNADVESCLVELYVDDADGALPPRTTGVSITKKNDADASGDFSVKIAQPTRPSNLRVTLGDATVWTSGGPLTDSIYELPDAADALNAFLDKQTGATRPLKTLSFDVHSDTSGKIGLRITSLTFSQVKTQMWPNPLDGTVRNDRSSEVGFGAIVRLPLDPLIDVSTVPVKLDQLTLDADGKIDSDRLLGQVETHDGREFATVSTDYSIAQEFTLIGNKGTMLHSPVKCSGVAACVIADAEAELYAEIQGDNDGAPASGIPLGKGTAAVAPAIPNVNTPPWALVRFAATVSLDVDKPYWLVLKAVQGSMELALVGTPTAGAAPNAFSRQRLSVSRASQVWKPFGRDDAAASVALAGVIYVPTSDDQTAAAQVAISGTPQQDRLLLEAVDPAPKPRTFVLKTADVDWRQATLEVHCYATGTLHIANVIQRFKVG